MYLRNTEKYLDILEIYPDDNVVNRFVIDKDDERNTNGFFCEVNGQLFGLGVSNKEIFTILNGHVYPNKIITITCLTVEDHREFCAYKNNKLLHMIKYEPQEPHWNFYTMEDEDVDSLLLMKNILSSDERKSIFIDNN